MTTRNDERVPNHAEVRANRYLASGSWRRETTIERFRSVVRDHGDRDAVVGLDGTATYDELDRRSDQIAVWLMDAGLPVGGPVIMQVGNSVESVVAFYALLKAGAVPVAALAAHRSHEIGHITGIVRAAGHLIDTSVSDGVLVDVAQANVTKHPSVQHLFTVGPAPSGFARLRDVGHDIAPTSAHVRVDAVQDSLDHRDVAVFQLSGGTTGTPKVIPRLHAEYWNNAVANSRALHRTSDSRIAHIMPIVHNAGVINALFGAHAVGGCAVVLPFAGPDDTLTALVNARVSDMMIGSPVISWFDHPLWSQLADTLEVVIYSGSKPPAGVLERCAEQGIWMGQTWGMAEGPYTTTPFEAPLGARRDTVGLPVFGSDDEMLIVDVNTHEPLPHGVAGMLVFRGPSTLAGYFDAAEHNLEAFTAQGFLITGDLAMTTERDGLPHLSIEGRIKDVISRGGEKISTEEVEKLLRQHPAISDAAVVAMPDERLGERACAYVTLSDGATAVELVEVQQHFAALGVAKFKWPERLEILDALPRTPTLKIDKLALRRHIADRVSSGTLQG